MKQFSIFLITAFAAVSAEASPGYLCVGFGESAGQSLAIQHGEENAAQAQLSFGKGPSIPLGGTYEVKSDDFYSSLTTYELADSTGAAAELEVVAYVNIGRGGCGRGGCVQKTETSAKLTYLDQVLTYDCQKVVP